MSDRLIGSKYKHNLIDEINSGYSTNYSCFPSINFNGYDYVDLGVEDEIFHYVFAKANVGANTWGERGNYYAWGNFNVTNWEILVTTREQAILTDKYSTNTEYTGQCIDDDIAHAVMGGSWEMIDTDVMGLLLKNFNPIYDYKNGYFSFSGNGQTLYFPLHGSVREDKWWYIIGDGSNGYIWLKNPPTYPLPDSGFPMADLKGSSVTFINSNNELRLCNVRGMIRIPLNLINNGEK